MPFGFFSSKATCSDHWLHTVSWLLNLYAPFFAEILIGPNVFLCLYLVDFCISVLHFARPRASLPHNF